LLDHAVLHRAEEAHGQQHQVGIDGELVPGWLELGRRSDARGVQLLHVAALRRRVKPVVATLQSRVPPSSCELSMRSCIGQSGHGVDGERSSGGLGSSSNW
jgi:uncharacterized membrane protein YgcG